MQEALLYTKRKNLDVDCFLCNHFCTIANHRRGLCGVRENRDGVLQSLVYGKIVAENVDPIEKKPLFHVFPGSRTLSISTVGCNFSCRHCQNASVSQPGSFSADAVPGQFRTAEDIVANAVATGCDSISYTYVEPTIFIEFAIDCMELGYSKGLRNYFVSNGYMSEEAVKLLLPFLDAINIDLKSFSDSFYRKICAARLQPVLDTIQSMSDAGVWVEVTTLLIPGLNDSEKELQEIADFLVSVDPSIPWHVTGFYPAYKLTECLATSPESLEKARQIGIAAGLNFVYVGNRPGTGGENTYCPSCAAELITRRSFSILKDCLKDGRCQYCNYPISGLWG